MGSYLSAAGNLIESPLTAGDQVLQDIASWSSIWDPFYNELGYVGPGQKQNLIVSELTGMVQAGTSETQAAQQSVSDVTNVLIQAGADPSQATGLQGIGTILTYIISGAALIALIWFLIEAVKIL